LHEDLIVRRKGRATEVIVQPSRNVLTRCVNSTHIDLEHRSDRSAVWSEDRARRQLRQKRLPKSNRLRPLQRAEDGRHFCRSSLVIVCPQVKSYSIARVVVVHLKAAVAIEAGRNSNKISGIGRRQQCKGGHVIPGNALLLATIRASLANFPHRGISV